MAKESKRIGMNSGHIVYENEIPFFISFDKNGDLAEKHNLLNRLREYSGEEQLTSITLSTAEEVFKDDSNE